MFMSLFNTLRSAVYSEGYKSDFRLIIGKHCKLNKLNNKSMLIDLMSI